MSKPRKPFGANQPGRLPATVLKVLAAEMSDPARLRRGKQYAKNGSVLDIIVEPGVVTCEVQGSRSTPYIASLEVSLGDGLPQRRDVHAVCNCPDDDNWDDHACKHVIATMYAFADELLIEPELLDVWRGVAGSAAGALSSASGRQESEQSEERDGPARPRRHLELVRDGVERGRSERSESHDRRRRDGDDAAADEPPVVDPLAQHLRLPAGRRLPTLPDFDRDEPVLPRRPELAAVLRDAYAHLRIDWD